MTQASSVKRRIGSSARAPIRGGCGRCGKHAGSGRGRVCLLLQGSPQEFRSSLKPIDRQFTPGIGCILTFMVAQGVLWDLAADQHGFFTTSDALGAGVTRKAVDHLLARREVDRVGHGVYRFPTFPTSPADPYQLAVLWTGTAGACLSHETALEVHGVTDLLPDRIHVTVPAGRRIRRAGGEAYCVHRQDLTADQLGWWEQIATVTLPTAIIQCIGWGTPTYLIRQGIDQGTRTGALLAEEAGALTTRLEARSVHA